MSSHVRHERTDASVPAVLGAAAGLLIAGIVIYLLVWAMLQFLNTRADLHTVPEFPLARHQAERLPPEPRLQTNPRGDLLALREKEDRLLTTYGWVDRNSGVVRIPIDRAMALTVERGLPVRASKGGDR
jgi:hypothetical protein